MKVIQYWKPDMERWPMLWTLLCMSSRGLEVHHEELGKGLVCIFPAKQGSQMGSGRVFKSMAILVTRLWWSRNFTSARWWWASHLCHKARSRGIVVAADANSTSGAISPSRKAQLLIPMFATKCSSQNLLEVHKVLLSCSDKVQTRVQCE